VVKNSVTLFKRLFIGGILYVGLIPGIAQAKWIKASVTGIGVAPSPTNQVQLDFVLYNYTTTTANVWNQTLPAYGYGYGPVPLYGFGTGVSNSSPQTLQGPFDAHYQPGTGGNTFALMNDGNFDPIKPFIELNGSTTIPYLGKGFPGNQGDTVTTIQLLGGPNPLISTGPMNPQFSSAGSPNVVDFLRSAIATTGSSYSCSPSPCGTGTINFTAEGAFNFTWTNVQFDEIESVPAPLPIFGALSAFGFSRKLRKRINGQKIGTII
jgi:hypothetical protein